MQRIGVGLIRVSTGAQAEDDRASIPAQREIIKQIAARHQIDVAQIFELADISGAEVAHSPKYHAFLNRLKDPAVTCVITREFSRLMRPERFDDFGILQHFVDCGITLYFPQDVLDLSNRQARFMAGIRAGVSGLERGDIAERIASAKEILRKKGHHPCGEHTLARGLGHTKAKGWYWDENELASVRLLFRLFLEEGCRVYLRLAELTGIPRTSIRTILKNPVYAGWMVYSQRHDPTAAGLVPRDQNRKGYRRKIARSAEDVIRVKLPLEPLITEDQHQEILNIVEGKRRHFSSVRTDASPRFVYRSFLYCGSCGQPLYTWVNAKGRDYYHCRSMYPRYQTPGWTGCSNRYMSRILVEPKLDDVLVAHLTDTSFLCRTIEAHYRQRIAKLGVPTEDLLEAQFENLSAKRRRIIEAFFDGNISQLQKNEYLRDVDVQIEVLNAVRPAIISELPEFGHDQIAPVVQTFQDWKHLEAAERRMALERLLPEIYVDRYVVRGVSLRAGRNYDNPSPRVVQVTTFPQPADSSQPDLIYVPFNEGVTV